MNYVENVNNISYVTIFTPVEGIRKYIFIYA